MHGRHLLKSWSSTQAVIALSVGESEYYGLVKGASEGLGLRSSAGDFGLELDVLVHTDSSAAKGMASRLGLRKRTRHVAVHLLWVQERVESGDIRLLKIPGNRNPADMGTKHLAADRVEYCLSRMGGRAKEGRHHLAPKQEENPAEATRAGGAGRRPGGEVRVNWADLQEEEEEERRGTSG